MKIPLNDPRLELVDDGQLEFPVEVLAAASVALANQDLLAKYSELVPEGDAFRGNWYGVTSTRLIVVRGGKKTVTDAHDGHVADVSAEVLDLTSLRSATIASFTPRLLTDFRHELDIRVSRVALKVDQRDDLQLPETSVGPNVRDRWEAFSQALLAAVGTS